MIASDSIIGMLWLQVDIGGMVLWSSYAFL